MPGHFLAIKNDLHRPPLGFTSNGLGLAQHKSDYLAATWVTCLTGLTPHTIQVLGGEIERKTCLEFFSTTILERG